jgi:NitT/TauT family transport system ATP-binding protein
MNTIISLDHVTKLFDGRAAVDDLTFSLAAGEVVALLGQTGAGKSTVLNMIHGQIRPNSGKVTVEGIDPYLDYYGLRGKMAASFQSDRLLPWRTARQNVELGLEFLRRPKRERAERASQWLSRVKLNPSHHDKYPHQLSGGMRQRVSLARALVVDPDLVLLDESFSQLDHVTSKLLRADFLSLVKELRKTCVLITHRIDDALEMADRIMVLAAPARIALEIKASDSERSNPNWIASSTAKISEVMGADVNSAEAESAF